MRAQDHVTVSPQPRVLLVVESGTDVRLIDGLARRTKLSILLRAPENYRAINWPYEGEASVEIHRLSLDHFRFAARALEWLVRRRDAYDAVIVQNYGVSALAASIARLALGIPTFLLICSPNVEYFATQRKKRSISLGKYIAGTTLLRACRAGNARLGASYVTLSPYLSHAIGPVAPQRRHVIPVYGVDTSLFRPAHPGEARVLRRAQGIPEDAFVILFSSRIAPEKDVETLVGAAKLLTQRGRRFLLVNMSGGYREFLSVATAAGLKDFVRGLDAVHPTRDLPPYYRSADVCVQASLEEGLGLSVLEALASELPVVASAVGGLRDTIRDGLTGYTFAPGDKLALANHLDAVREHPEEALKRARVGLAMVRSEYESSVVFDKLVSTIQAAVVDRTVHATRVGTAK